MLLFFSEKDDEKLRHAWKTMWSLLKNDQGDYQLFPRYKVHIVWSVNKQSSFIYRPHVFLTEEILVTRYNSRQGSLANPLYCFS